MSHVEKGNGNVEQTDVRMRLQLGEVANSLATAAFSVPPAANVSV